MLEEQPRPTGGARPSDRGRELEFSKGTESWRSKRRGRDAEIEVWRCWRSNRDPPRLVMRGEAEMVKAEKPRGRGDAEIVTGGAWRADTVREEVEMVTGDAW